MQIVYKILHLDKNHELMLEQLQQAGFENHEDYTSTKEEIQKVEDAYQALSPEQQAQVVGYEKIATLLTALELKEGAELDQIAARKVIEMIATLTDESSREEIEAVRAAFEALSDEAKALIPKSTLEILVYFESRLAELSEIAQK